MALYSENDSKGAGLFLAFREIAFPLNRALERTLDCLGRGERLQCADTGGGQVAGHAMHTKAVAPVRGNRNFNNRVVQAH